MEGFKQEEIDTLEKLYKFCDKFEYSTTKFQFCADIVKRISTEKHFQIYYK